MTESSSATLLAVLDDLAAQWMRQPDSAYDCGATLAAIVEWARASTTKVVEYRAVGTGPSGFQHETRSSLADIREDVADWSQRDGWTGVGIESRTVCTWATAWVSTDDPTGAS